MNFPLHLKTIQQASPYTRVAAKYWWSYFIEKKND
jgi:hypothetical protein